MDTYEAELQRAYREVPYEMSSHPFTHPERLYAIARMLGRSPVDPRSCRVVELGCAQGGNLLPMAESLPGSQFVGIDMSPDQISKAEEFRHAAALSNVTLHAMDFKGYSTDLQSLDYIIAHGFYSWVSPEDREFIFRFAAKYLQPNGILYLSYNTYPGWFSKCSLRECLLFHTRHCKDLAERIAAVRELAGWVRDADPSQLPPWADEIKVDLEGLAALPDHTIAHEYLEGFNDPVYCHELFKEAAEAGLYYVAEADGRSASLSRSGAWDDVAGRATSSEEREFLLDLAVNRSFRRSFFMRHELAAPREPDSSALFELWLTATAFPLGAAQYQSEDEMQGRVDPLEDAVLQILLTHYPAALQVQFVYEQLKAVQTDLEPKYLAQCVIGLLKERLVELRGHPAISGKVSGKQPVVSPLARVQASKGAPIVNRYHRSQYLPDLLYCLMPEMDGSRSLEDLSQRISKLFESEAARFPEELRICQAANSKEEGTRWLAEALLDLLEESALLC